ncbi:hypothetical protein RT94_02660 [Pseudomonas viridiflava]|nr:hypothetical protein RT94_02660 [Pseudomonas viridiflava]
MKKTLKFKVFFFVWWKVGVKESSLADDHEGVSRVRPQIETLETTPADMVKTDSQRSTTMILIQMKKVLGTLRILITGNGQQAVVHQRSKVVTRALLTAPYQEGEQRYAI